MFNLNYKNWVAVRWLVTKLDLNLGLTLDLTLNLTLDLPLALTLDSCAAIFLHAAIFKNLLLTQKQILSQAGVRVDL